MGLTAEDQANAVLLFDEAGALFGNRTKVKDVQDSDTTVEVTYLLRRKEEAAPGISSPAACKLPKGLSAGPGVSSSKGWQDEQADRSMAPPRPILG
ncbi:MAG: hypothetical protein R3245_06905 [Kiloniellales bacterium]|nr:hypothetical protein [Kiloniellales bacterium]